MSWCSPTRLVEEQAVQTIIVILINGPSIEKLAKWLNETWDRGMEEELIDEIKVSH